MDLNDDQQARLLISVADADNGDLLFTTINSLDRRVQLQVIAGTGYENGESVQGILTIMAQDMTCYLQIRNNLDLVMLYGVLQAAVLKCGGPTLTHYIENVVANAVRGENGPQGDDQGPGNGIGPLQGR